MRSKLTQKKLRFCLFFGLLYFVPQFFASGLTEDVSFGKIEYAYGVDPLQKLDFWPAKETKPAALLMFVHGGGWKRGDKNNATGWQKVEHFLSQGYAFASINYRLVPHATLEEQAADVASAVAWLHSNALQLGIDTSRIILMGHSAGAQLVALVGTDPQYLTTVGLSLADLRGVIALDGACYDVPRQIVQGNLFMRNTYLETFGKDTLRQRRLSATFQTDLPNAQSFLIIHIDRTDGKIQSEALAAALVKAGTPAEVYGIDEKGLQGHLDVNNSLGRSDFPATLMVDTWLQRLAGFR